MKNLLSTHTTLLTWTGRLLRVGLILALAAGFSLQAGDIGIAHAQDGGGDDDGGGDLGPGAPLIEVIYSVAEAFIKVLVFSSVAIFAASIARGTWSAQLANLVGSPLGMSQAWMNVVTAIFTFIVAILSPLIVSMVFDIVQGFVAGDFFTIPTF